MILLFDGFLSEGPSFMNDRVGMKHKLLEKLDVPVLDSWQVLGASIRILAESCIEFEPCLLVT